VSPLALTLIGVAVFVVVGAAGALKFGDWLDRRRRKTKRAEAESEFEREVW
jgi:hypothetical protein